MKIIIAQPPNIEEIRKVFTFTRRVIFAYGDVIYNPDNINLDAAMIAHEHVHFEQQSAMGVERWWEEYLRNPEFRLRMEIPAYRMQYEVAKHVFHGRLTPGYAEALAKALSGDTYGYCISYSEAFKFIIE